VAKKDDKAEDTVSKAEPSKRDTWLAAEQIRAELEAKLDAATKAASRAASDYVAERIFQGNTSTIVPGPGGANYIAGKARKPKGAPDDFKPENPYTLTPERALRA
jgi:hypothetical protein